MPIPIDHDKWDAVCAAYREHRSIRKAAAALGMSKTGVEYILKQRGIKRLPRNRSGAESSSVKAAMADPDSPSAKVRDPALMTDMYVDRKMSTSEIADELGCDPKTVWAGLKFCGIPTRSVSEALRGKGRPSMRGAKNPAWNGGSTGWRKLAREGLNASFVRPCMERDGFACQWCGSTKKIVVHHHNRTFMDIVRQVESENPGAKRKQLVRAIIEEHTLDDGVTLCKKCHDAWHKEHGK